MVILDIACNRHNVMTVSVHELKVYLPSDAAREEHEHPKADYYPNHDSKTNDNDHSCVTRKHTCTVTDTEKNIEQEIKESHNKSDDQMKQELHRTRRTKITSRCHIGITKEIASDMQHDMEDHIKFI